MSSDRDDPGKADTLAQSSESAALRERPEGDAVVRAVARSKIANALFSTSELVTIGRYRLLERVGVGGMGVVWGAWDPQLERRVALKLVKVKTDDARERMLAEGQTLAKLSHPNVVPIYDVGTVEDQVYLVMEWIRGDTLRGYCKEPRTIGEVVRLYRSAGEGLVAAHRAGIIHRDFKPDNVMLGEDGRVRVLDFGLARTESDNDGHVAGTPRYMAPEQARGDALTAASDQFAFCVSLKESLTTRDDATVPGWIAAIIARGTEPVAADRFASMDALLHALARDPRTVWRRRVIALGALAATGAAFAVGTMRSHGPEACAGSAGELAQVWNQTARGQILSHGLSLGPYGVAESKHLETSLGAYGQRWTAAHRGACLAHRRGEVTERLYENGLACIQRARAALGAVTEVLGRAPIEKYPDAVAAARALPDVDRCIVDATDSAVVPPDRSIAGVVGALGADATRASYLALAGDPQALTLARPLVAAADRIGYGPLVARTHLALGSALALQTAGYQAAVSAYAASAAAALASSDDVMFVEAFARELFTAGRLEAEDVPVEARNATAMLPFAEAIAKRTGSAGSFARTLLYNNAGTLRLSDGDPIGARAWFRKARDELRAGAAGFELWVALGNLATVTESRDERDALFSEERANLERALGPTHAFTLTSRMRAAGYLEHRDLAGKTLADVCDAIATWYPHRIDQITRCRYEVGWLADERGDRDAERAAYLSTTASSQDEAKRARVQLALLDGKVVEAERAATELAELSLKDTSWFSRFPGGVDAFLIAANARLALGNTDGAIAALRSALAILEDARLNKSAARYQRRLARIQAQLALLLVKRDRAQAGELAAKAISWSKSAGGYDDRVRELERITADR